MNKKFLYIILFLQSSLWAINTPHERPSDEQEKPQTKKTKKFVSPLHQLCHEGPIEDIIAYLENSDVSDEINTLEENITPFARCMSYCQNNQVNKNIVKQLIKLFIAKDAQIDLLSINNLKSNLLKDIFNESVKEESEQISDTKMHNLLLLYYKYSEDKLVFNALDKKNHGKFFDKLKNYLDEISNDYEETIKYNDKKTAFLNIFDPLYKLFTSNIFNNINDKHTYIKIVLSALDDTICAELPHWQLFFEFYSLKNKIENFNYENIDMKSDAYIDLIKDINKMSNYFINIDYKNSLYDEKYWLRDVFYTLFKHLNKYYHDELNNYKNDENQFFNYVFCNFTLLYKKHMNFLYYAYKENDISKNLYYNILSSKQPHLLFDEYSFILNIQFSSDSKVIELTKNIALSLSDIRNKNLTVEKKIIGLANLLFTKSSVQYFNDADVGETINHIWELWNKKLFKTIDFFIKDFKPLLDIILYSNFLSNHEIKFLTKLEYFNLEDEKTNYYLDYLLNRIIDEFFNIKSTPHKHRINGKIEILKEQLIFNKNNLIKKIYEKLITKEIPKTISNKQHLLYPDYVASLTNIELISDLFDDNVIFDDKECTKLINISIANNKFDILELFLEKIKNIQYRTMDIQLTNQQEFIKLFDLLLKYNININNISINKNNLTKYLMDNLTIIDEEQSYKLVNNFILHNNLNEVDFFLKKISHKDFTKITIPKLKNHGKYIELFKTLLQNNINLNDQNFSDSMIHPAQDINVAKFLLANNITYKAKWLLKNSYNNPEIIKFLKDNNITLTNDQYYELVNGLMINGDFESMGFFLKKIPHKDFTKITIPELQYYKPYLELFNVLLNNDIDLNHKHFLFSIAYAAQDVEVAELLLSKGINYTFEWLLKACEQNKPGMIDFFHSKGFNFKLTNSTGHTCFIQYIENIYLKENDSVKKAEVRNIINTLLNCGFDIDEEGRNQKSALSCAVKTMQPFLVGYLIEKGAKITKKHIILAASVIPIQSLHCAFKDKNYKKAILAFLLFNNKTNNYNNLINRELFNELLKIKNNFFKAIADDNLVKMKKYINKGYGFLVNAIENNVPIILKYEEILSPEMLDLLAEFMPAKRGHNTKSARKT